MSKDSKNLSILRFLNMKTVLRLLSYLPVIGYVNKILWVNLSVILFSFSKLHNYYYFCGVRIVTAIL